MASPFICLILLREWDAGGTKVSELDDVIMKRGEWDSWIGLLSACEQF